MVFSKCREATNVYVKDLSHRTELVARAHGARHSGHVIPAGSLRLCHHEIMTSLRLINGISLHIIYIILIIYNSIATKASVAPCYTPVTYA